MASDLIPKYEDPIALFSEWFTEAQNSEINDHDAMSLATCALDNKPSVRMVLLKGFSRAGFVFYTNKQSKKGSQISDNKQAAMCFHWKSLRKQVRIEGELEVVKNEVADKYFASRSRNSQLSAWASKQSEGLVDRVQFVEEFQLTEERFNKVAVPRPKHWSGFCLNPVLIEFWCDQPFRMHDRLEYQKDGEFWKTQRLYP
tara:strand:+ start:889 stop:1488 length:600 start_codon:yes stop_codon:yes gene_type:complete